MNIGQPARQSVPLLRGSEEQVVKLRKRLEEVFRNVSLAHDVVTICIELRQGNSGDFNAEMAHVLRRCAADNSDHGYRAARRHDGLQQCRGGNPGRTIASAPNYQRSRQILQALVQGVDPEKGSELPADTVLNRVDVVRALLTAIDALDSVSARALRRAQLPESVGKRWSEEDERQLKEGIRGRRTYTAYRHKARTHRPRH